MPRRRLLALTLLAAMTFAAYLPVVRNGEVWDDDAYITRPVVGSARTLSDLWNIWADPFSTIQYYPLVHTSFWVEYHLWGLNMAGYHLVNVALHALAACLLFLVFRRLALPGGEATAWVGAAIWALHPMGVESVAWATERKNVMAAALGFGAFLALLRFYRIGEPTATDTQAESPAGEFDRRWFAPALGLFVAALLAKTVVSTLPAVGLLVLWWKKPRLSWKMVLPLAPFLVIGLPMARFTAYMEVYHANAVGPDWEFTPAEHMLIAGRVAWFYVGQFLWPHPLVFIYPRWLVDAGAWQQYLFPAGVVVVLVVLAALVRRIGRGPLAGVLIYGVMLSPAMGLFPVYAMRFSFVADHFAYLALAVLAAVLTGAAAGAARRLGAAGRRVGGVAAGVVLLALTAATWGRCLDYRDAWTLWQDTYEKNPRSMIANTNMAEILLAKKEVERAIQLDQESVDLNGDRIYPHEALGTLLVKVGRYDQGLRELEWCVKRYGEWHVPERGLIEAAIGNVYLSRQQWGEAGSEFSLALNDCPWSVDAWHGLTLCLIHMNRIPEAAETLDNYLKQQPNDDAAWFNLGVAREHLGQFNEAANAYLGAVRANPDYIDAHVNLGRVYERFSQYQLAAEQFAAAARLDPGNRQAQHGLAAALMAAGQYDAALPVIAKAVEITHGQDAGELEALARVQGLMGRYGDAAGTASRALAVAQLQSHPDAIAVARIKAMLGAFEAGKPWPGPGTSPAPGTSP